MWHCLECKIKTNLDNLPLTLCDNFDLMNINNTDSMRLLESLPNVAIVNEAISFSECSSNDSSIELPR